MSDWKNVQYKDGKLRTNEGGGGSSHAYSTTEHTVGTWTDGKTIYEITIPDTMPTVSTEGTYVSKQVSCSSLNIDMLVDMSIILDQNPSYVKLPYINNSGNMSKAYYDESNSAVMIWSSMAVHSQKAIYITIQYTKTTD